MIDVKDLQKTFISGDTKVKAVDGVSFQVSDGQFVSIVGRSGSGKSTLLSLLGGLEAPSKGVIEVDKQDIAHMRDHALIQYRARKIGFVFQNYNLIPNLSALENVMLPMEFTGVPIKQRKERARHLLEQVGLSKDEIDRKPGRLSGGQQQRVSIARALANKPKLILADEPTGNLDSATGTVIFNLLHGLAQSEQTTIIVVTHDLAIAGQTDKTYTLSDGKLT